MSLYLHELPRSAQRHQPAKLLLANMQLSSLTQQQKQLKQQQQQATPQRQTNERKHSRKSSRNPPLPPSPSPPLPPHRHGYGRWHQVLVPFVREYCNTSSLHGIRYLTDAKLLHFEKIIWLLLLLATSVCAIYVYIDISQLYHTERIHTTVDDPVYPIFRIPFPSVGLCPRNRINWQLLLHEAPERFLGQNASSLQRDVFIAFFRALADVHLSRLDALSAVFDNDTLHRHLHRVLHDVDVLQVMRYLTLNCTDLFGSVCRWRNLNFNCCELFSIERTEAGYCYVFNSAVSPLLQQRKRSDKFYPYHNPKYGEGTGLNFYLTLNRSGLQSNFSGARGIFVMIKQPEQWHDDVRFVSRDTYTKIVIYPRLTTTHNRTRAVSPKERHCIFDDEANKSEYKRIPGLVYWRGNCRTRCHQDYVQKYCNCTPSLLFPITMYDNYSDCKVSQYKCLYTHRDVFSAERMDDEDAYVPDIHKDSMTCNCPNSCDVLVYDKSFSSMPLDYLDHESTKGSINLDIFFHSQYIIKYGTKMRFTFVELLASFGGIIGLFLGASLLSAIELIYFFTVGLYIYLQDKWRVQRTRATPAKRTHQPPLPKIVFID